MSSKHKCNACSLEAEAVKAGEISARSPVHKASTQFYFEGDSVSAWGTDGADDKGGVWFRDLKPCDHIVGVQAAILDSNGEPVITTASIQIFSLRRSDQRQNATRSVAGWRSILQQQTRVNRGGIVYASTAPRELNVNSFGRGWDVGGDWAQVSGRDPLEAPVLVVLYRKATAAATTFQCAITFKACNK